VIREDDLVTSPIAALIDVFYEQLWNRWNDSAVDATLDAEFDFRGSLGQRTSGRDEWRSYRDAIRAGSADFHNQVIALVCEDRRGAARLRYTGTHTGELLGIAATHRRFEYAGAAFFTSDGHSLTSAWVLGDVDGLRRQLQ